MKKTGEKCRYKAVALGGTFDVFHDGHAQLLFQAFKLSELVLIGITSDQLVKTFRKAHPVQNYRTRARRVRLFLKEHGWIRRAEIHRLADPFGPTASEENLQAVVVTSRTLPNGRKLNRERKRRGLKPLEIQTVALARGQDGAPISSTRIRNGEIDRQGRILPRSHALLPKPNTKTGIKKVSTA